jgi:hypothetical protein
MFQSVRKQKRSGVWNILMVRLSHVIMTSGQEQRYLCEQSKTIDLVLHFDYERETNQSALK